jgi:polysaccharide deacetylase family protein (PEP-CTERM system associated)
MMSGPPVRHVLTIDLEDWFHPLEPDPGRWPAYARRAAKGTHTLLDLLRAHGAQATFFVLGDVARNSPDLIREIAASGHEIGTHGMVHQIIGRQTPDEFRRELRDSIYLLESITGNKVQSYRAPVFSINRSTLWALDILREEGIRRDSSIFPIRNPRYGIPQARRTPHEIVPGLWEWPPSTLPTLLGNLPIAGGVYLRLLPECFIRYGIRMLERRGEPVVLYLHPWEVDPEQPRLEVRSRFLRLRHYTGLARTAGKLARILGNARYTSLARAADLLTESPR